MSTNEINISEEVAVDDVPKLISIGRPYSTRLEAWHSSLPKELGMGSTRLRKLCSNGSYLESNADSSIFAFILSCDSSNPT
jgi:hypothetical protein